MRTRPYTSTAATTTRDSKGAISPSHAKRQRAEPHGSTLCNYLPSVSDEPWPWGHMCTPNSTEYSFASPSNAAKQLLPLMT